jgi:hypothetical protein
VTSKQLTGNFNRRLVAGNWKLELETDSPCSLESPTASTG